jgi:mRNA interferase HicA
MRAGEFIRQVEHIGRQRGIETGRGKGSHGTLFFGERFTVVVDRRRELKTGLLHAMLRQLGLRLSDIE